MRLSAKDQTTNKIEKITITNDKGRLSEEEIQRMVDKAKQFEEEDAKFLGKVNAKNQLEGYLFQIKNTMSDKQLEGKISSEDKDKILSTVDSGIKWLESNSDSTKEEIEKKQKEVEEIVNPIMQKLGGGQSNNTNSNSNGYNQKPEENETKPKFDDMDVD
jgi:heat shock 70kDa protein 1/2/6/8